MTTTIKAILLSSLVLGTSQAAQALEVYDCAYGIEVVHQRFPSGTVKVLRSRLSDASEGFLIAFSPDGRSAILRPKRSPALPGTALDCVFGADQVSICSMFQYGLDFDFHRREGRFVSLTEIERDKWATTTGTCREP